MKHLPVFFPLSCPTFRIAVFFLSALSLSPAVSRDIFADTLRLRILYGKTSGEQVEERKLKYLEYNPYTSPYTFSNQYLMSNAYYYEKSYIRKNVYEKKHDYIGAEADYEKKFFVFRGFIKTTGTNVHSGKAYRSDSYSCSRMACEENPYQINTEILSVTDTANRISIPYINADVTESGKSYLNENAAGMEFYYFPFTSDEKKQGIYFLAGFNVTSTIIRVEDSFMKYKKSYIADASDPRIFLYMYIPGKVSSYSGRDLGFPIGAGYKKSLKWIDVDGQIMFLKGSSEYHGTTRSPASITHNDWKQDVKGYGFQYRLRFTEEVNESYEIGFGFTGRHYYAQGREWLQGGGRRDIFIANQIMYNLKDFYTPPVYIGIKEDGIEFFATRKFDL